MIASFSARLGEQLAERWLALVLGPGLVFTAVFAAGAILRQGHALDVSLLDRDVRTLVTDGRTGGLGLVAFAAGLLAAVLMFAGVARFGGRAVVLVWSGDTPRWVAWPLWAITNWRWARAHDHAESVAREIYQATRRISSTDPEVLAAVARLDRIAVREPVCATWIGNRFVAMRDRVRAAHRVSLSLVWPALWLVFPDRLREDLTTARRAFEDAAATTAWGLMYFVLGVLWWPAVFGGVVITALGWSGGRTAADGYAGLVEAAVDAHVGDIRGGHDIPDGHDGHDEGVELAESLRA